MKGDYCFDHFAFVYDNDFSRNTKWLNIALNFMLGVGMLFLEIT